MSTVMLTGMGGIGTWALEFLARSPEVDRIVTVKRSPWTGVSAANLAMLGSTFQGHTKQFEHHQLDLADGDAAARLLAEVRPDVILHSATVQSPRMFMNAAIDEGLRAEVRAATFSLWLPWHLWPASLLVRAAVQAGVEPRIVNAAFPDVVNEALWKHFGFGPAAGIGNVELCAAAVLRYAMAAAGRPAEAVRMWLVGSHALMTFGAAAVPHCFRLEVGGVDVTSDYDLDCILSSWPEPIVWSKVDSFSVFAASAVKNAVALLGEAPLRTHVTGPMGMPGGYPAFVSGEGVELDLPPGLTVRGAAAMNEAAARLDGIERIEADGTVVYTPEIRAAMENIGYRCEAVTFEELPRRCLELRRLYEDLVAKGRKDA